MKNGLLQKLRDRWNQTQSKRDGAVRRLLELRVGKFETGPKLFIPLCQRS